MFNLWNRSLTIRYPFFFAADRFSFLELSIAIGKKATKTNVNYSLNSSLQAKQADWESDRLQHDTKRKHTQRE